VGISFRRMMPYYEWRFGVARRADVIDNHVNFPRAVMTGTCAISVAARALRSLITVKKLMERKFFVHRVALSISCTEHGQRLQGESINSTVEHREMAVR